MKQHFNIRRGNSVRTCYKDAALAYTEQKENHGSMILHGAIYSAYTLYYKFVRALLRTGSKYPGIF